MSLQTDIREKLTAAMKSRTEPDLTVLRGLTSMMTQELTATGRKPTDALTDDEAVAVVKRALKQRAEAASQFRQGGRDDLAESEEAEAKVIEQFLPPQMSEEEIKSIAERKKAELGVTDKSKMGILIGAVMKEAGSSADGAVVKRVVESLL